MIVKKSAIGANTGDKTLLMAHIKDREKIFPDKRLSTPEIDLENFSRNKLVDHAKALIEGKFSFFAPP